MLLHYVETSVCLESTHFMSHLWEKEMQEKVDWAGKVPRSVLLLPLLPPSGFWGGASSSSRFLWAKGGVTPGRLWNLWPGVDRSPVSEGRAVSSDWNGSPMQCDLNRVSVWCDSVWSMWPHLVQLAVQLGGYLLAASSGRAWKDYFSAAKDDLL